MMHASPFAPLVELPSADTATWRLNGGDPRLAFRAGRIPADPSFLRGYRPLRFILDLTGFLVAWRIAPLLSGLEAMGESSGLFSGSALPAVLSPLGSDWVSLPFALCFLGAVWVGAKRMAEGRVTRWRGEVDERRVSTRHAPLGARRRTRTVR